MRKKAKKNQFFFNERKGEIELLSSPHEKKSQKNHIKILEKISLTMMTIGITIMLLINFKKYLQTLF